MNLNDRSDLKRLRLLLEQTIGSAVSPHDLFAEVGSMKFTFDGSNCHMKVTVRKGDSSTYEREAFKKSVLLNQHQFPFLSEDHYGLTFVQRGENWMLYGLENRPRRGPTFLAKKVSTGKSYRIPAQWISDAVMRQSNDKASGVRKRRQLEIA